MSTPHLGDLPEGLHFDFDGVGITIRDAQDHPWVSIHEAAFGDPPIWREAILHLVSQALGIPDPVSDP